MFDLYLYQIKQYENEDIQTKICRPSTETFSFGTYPKESLQFLLHNQAFIF